MSSSSRSLSTSHTAFSSTYPSYLGETTTSSRPQTNGARPRTRARTATSILGGTDQQIVCALTESRGVSPTVGLAFVNLSTTEAVLCQITDNQNYVRTIHKLRVFAPTEILFPSTATHPKQSTLFQIVETNLDESVAITPIDRRYWGEARGVEYIQQLAFKEDVEAIKVSIGGNFYATCCLCAVGGFDRGSVP